MLELKSVVIEDRPALPGDARGLVARLGSPDPVARRPVLAGLAEAGVVDAASLRAFLVAYREKVLGPIELAAIQRSSQFASRHEVRELLAFDAALGREPRLARFAGASQAVGRIQLRRLLPLRDQRLIRRYWGAVEAGRAFAWHPLVYGVFLSVFSLPLRQGLMHYGGQTLGGFLEAAATTLRLPGEERLALADEIHDALPPLVQRSLLPPEASRHPVCLLTLPLS